MIVFLGSLCIGIVAIIMAKSYLGEGNIIFPYLMIFAGLVNVYDVFTKGEYKWIMLTMYFACVLGIFLLLIIKDRKRQTRR
jgi:hypothetical protein